MEIERERGRGGEDEFANESVCSLARRGCLKTACHANLSLFSRATASLSG